MEQIFSKAVGIDLGTTNSAVAVMNRADDDVLIHRATRHTLTTPSCVWKDPKSGEVIVGRMAASRVGTKPAPIRSIKRLMGHPTTVRVTDEDMTPEQVSALILGEMKQQIEQDLREWDTPTASWVVDRAVVTVPAYFDHPNMEATRRAAELAGLEVVDLLHEPTAAAQYHCWSSRTTNGTFLVYDFGGGTFDVSVVRSTAGAFEVLGISGNNLLGGDNIDFEMAARIQEYLIDDGYAFALDPENDPEDRIRESRLRILAEGVKKALSTQEAFMLSDAGTLHDKNGMPVMLDKTVERSEFEELARPVVERTIGYCHEAIELATREAGVTIADIDQVILAGGTTHIPLVRELVAKQLCAKTRSATPVYEKVDTLVALGAAIRASASGGLRTYDRDRRVSIHFRGTGARDTTSALVAGVATALAPGLDLTGGRIRLTTDEYEDECAVEPDGGFAFRRIPIQPDAESRLTFEVFDSAGDPVVTLARSVTHNRDVPPEDPTTSGTLSKAFILEVNRNGKAHRKELLPALASLPASADFTFSHPGDTETVLFPLYQRTRKIQVISVPVPSTTARGTEIKFNVRVDAQQLITVRGSIGSITFDALVTQPPEREMPTPEEVESLQRRFDEDVQFLRPGERAVVEAKWRVTGTSLEVAMARGDRFQAVHEFEELEAILDEIGVSEIELTPPKAEFDKLVDVCRRLNADLPSVLAGREVPYSQQDTAAAIETQCDHGERAYRNQDQRAYKEAIEMLSTIRRYLVGIYDRERPLDSQDRAAIVLAGIRNLTEKIAEVSPLAEAANRIDLLEELRTVRHDLDEIAGYVHDDPVRAGQKFQRHQVRVEQITQILTPRKTGDLSGGALPEDHS